MLKDDDPGSGAFALFLRPHPGVFRQLMCPHPRDFANFFLKNANARGLARGLARGGGAWAQLELTDALPPHLNTLKSLFFYAESQSKRIIISTSTSTPIKCTYPSFADYPWSSQLYKIKSYHWLHGTPLMYNKLPPLFTSRHMPLSTDYTKYTLYA